MTIKEVLVIIGLAIPIAAFVNTVLYQIWYLPKMNRNFKEFESELKHDELINQEKWLLKRDACFNALNIADCMISNYSFENLKPEDILPAEVSTEDVRKCFNELACSCDSTEVIEILKRILFDSIKPDIIVDLRNAVRRELDFGETDFDKDRDKAFVGKVGADPRLKE